MDANLQLGKRFNRLMVDFSEDTSLRISQEAIYQALSVQGRGHCAAS